jgi:hypothetical protein
VALLERGDYAVGTSSRSSKMIHGGLRYLQNLDLGLVREALLERQLMVQLAPHLVYPTPFVVPSFAEERRDRKLGIGLNMYDVMATTRVGQARRDRAARVHADDYWSPDRHRTIPGDEASELMPALAASDEVRSCVATQWMRYVLRREETPGDMPSLEAVKKTFRESSYDMRELLIAIAGSDAFTRRISDETMIFECY